MNWQAAFSKIAQGKVLTKVPMSHYTSMGVGGKCDVMFVPDDIEDLCTALRFLKQSGINYYKSGQGTNLLVRDSGIRGVVIRMPGGMRNAECGVRGFEVKGDRVQVGAGVPLMGFIRKLAGINLGGLEELAGIPGTIGGAIWMNAGAFGSDIGSRVLSVTTVDDGGEIKRYFAADCQFAYRQSIFQKLPLEIIVEAEIQMMEEKKEVVEIKVHEVLEARRWKHHHGVRTAGSTFKNPPEISAGKLIEDAGLKGFLRGGAMVSEKHANFLINTGNATCGDILELIDVIRKKVEAVFGVTLELEIQVIP